MKKMYLAAFIVIGILIVSGVLFLRRNDTEENMGVILTLDDPIVISNVVHLALEQRGGSINDIEIEIRVLQTEGTVNITDPNVIGIIGLNSSGLSREVIPIANGEDIAIISHLATWPGLTRPGFGAGEPGIYYPSGQRNFFRTVPSDDQQGAAAALWLSQQDIEQVYIFSNVGIYSEGLAGVFEANANDFNFDIIGRDSINIEELAGDMSLEEAAEFVAPYVENLLSVNPDALYLPVSGITHPYIVAYLSAVLAERPDLIIIGGDGLSQITFDQESGIQGIFSTDVVPAFSITSAAEIFRADYETEYGEEPPSWALSLYDGVNIFFDAVERAGEADPQLILNELSNFGQFDGVLGTWNFDQNGDINANSISLRQLQDSGWEFTETIR